jgi:hypothetical protein
MVGEKYGLETSSNEEGVWKVRLFVIIVNWRSEAAEEVILTAADSVPVVFRVVRFCCSCSFLFRPP